jgi:hypothetical protein
MESEGGERSMRKLLSSALALAVIAAGCLIVTPDGEVIGFVAPARPIMVDIPDTQIKVVTGASGDVFYVDGSYWRFQGDRWWRSSVWNGGWTTVTAVPRAFLRIPATHRMHRVVKHHPEFKGAGEVKVRMPVKERPSIKLPTVERPVVKKRPDEKPAADRPVVRKAVERAVKKAVKEKAAAKKEEKKEKAEENEKERKAKKEKKGK